MAKIESLGRREGITKLAEAIQARSAEPTKSKENDNPDYVVQTRSLKERAQDLIDSGGFSGKDLDFLMEVAAEKEVK